MRNPKRINRISKLIGKIWRKNPNLRLGQLILNCFGKNEEVYYVEDDVIEDRLKSTYLSEDIN